MSKLDTAYGPFVELMSPGRVYVVPEYQRAYSWRPAKQITEIWGDISRLYDAIKTDPSNAEGHFIGSVVIGSTASRALGPVEAPVIDGQQRIITLTVIMIAVRDVLVDDPGDKQAINEQYLAHYKNGEISSLKVRPGDKDRSVLTSLVEGTDHYEKKHLIAQAYEHVTKTLRAGSGAEMDPDEQEPSEDEAGLAGEVPATGDDAATSKPWDWQVLIEVIGSRLELVSIADVPPALSYSIFASLNSTGLPLAQVDLVRNAVFMLLPTTGSKVHQEMWKPLESSFTSEQLGSYLHAWVMRRGHDIPAKETYRSVVKELSQSQDESKISAEVRTLFDDAWMYSLIIFPGKSDYEKFGRAKDVDVDKPANATVIDHLAKLREWGTKTAEPLLMEVLMRWRTGRISTSTATACLTHLESFLVRRFIAQVPPNDLRSIFARVTVNLGKVKDEDVETVLLSSLQETNRRWTTDEALKKDLLERPLYREAAQKQTFFILKRIAERLQGKECPHIFLGTAATQYSIEHVMPQTLSDAWKSDLEKWEEANPMQTWHDLCHVAGNLTLTAYNSELSNSSFEHKSSYIEEHLALKLSTSITQRSRWTSTEINDRSTELAEVAISIWPRP